MQSIRFARRATIAVGMFLALLLLPVSYAFAGVGGSAVPNFPTTVNVGDVFTATLTITNLSDSPNDTESIRVSGIFFTPSCQTAGATCANPDLGVFAVSNPVGTFACAGNTFSVTAPDVTGEVQFTSPTDVILGRSDSSVVDSKRCRVTFTVTVLKKATPGPGTFQLGRASLVGVTSQLPGDANGTDSTIVTGPAFTVAKTPDGQTINAGDVATFTIVVTNTGNGTANSVTLADLLPSGGGLVWTTATAGCTTSGLNLSCALGDIVSLASVTVVVSAQTSFQACTALPNPAAIATATNLAPVQDSGSITCVPPNLTVVKTPDGQTINAGDTATFTIVVTNTGAGIARNVTLSDPLPSGGGLTWTTATAGCTTSGLNLSCAFGDIAPLGSTTVVVSAKTSFAACTSLPNTATASATNNPNVSDPGVITCITPNLTVVKTPDGQTINAGDTATFTIVVSNIGAGIARAVTLADALPAGGGLTWTTATAGCTTSGLNLSCTFGDLNSNDTRTVVVSAKTSFAACASLPNTATASATNNPNASDTGLITCVPPNLQVVKTPDGQTISAGDTATFTIVVTNNGSGAATNVTLADPLPAGGGLTWTTATAGCTTSGLNLSCAFGDIAAGGSRTVVVSAKTSFQACTTLNNTATASSTNTPNASDTGLITCLTPALQVVKTPDGQTINVGDTATFTILVSNTGAGIARNVALTDTLPSGGGLTWTTATGGCAISGLNLTCGLGDIGPGGSTTVVVTAKTTATACTTMPNPAAVATPTNGASAQDSGSITCITAPGLQVVKTPDGQVIRPGDPAQFTIVVTVTGTGIATNVTLSDPLPDGGGVTWTTATTGCTTSGLNLSCSFGNLNAGDTRTVIVSAVTSATACTTMNNIATATSTNAGTANDNGSIICTPLPPPTIPTLSEWGMLLMMLLVAGTALVILRRRKRT